MLDTDNSRVEYDEYPHLYELFANESFKRIFIAIIAYFKGGFLRIPTTTDVTQILVPKEPRGFPVMLKSIDCMNWIWKNCPTEVAGL